MESMSAYEKHREAVKNKALELKRPLEVSQAALWAKAIAVQAFDGKFDGIYTAGSGDSFGFSEKLVNQCVELGMRRANEGWSEEDKYSRAWQCGYEAAQREFAKATGLFTEEDIDERF